jgi:hypothetical protein
MTLMEFDETDDDSCTNSSIKFRYFRTLGLRQTGRPVSFGETFRRYSFVTLHFKSYPDTYKNFMQRLRVCGRRESLQDVAVYSTPRHDFEVGMHRRKTVASTN